MTNDTTTLNGALAELGELMASNLEAKNVEADASEGLTTLANKILTIPPFIAGLDISTSLDLSTSNVINRISDTIVISTTLSCYFDDLSAADVDLTGLLQGATVDFYNNNTYIGSAITDMNGVAILSYVPSALGSFNIKAKFEGTDNYSYSISNTISITIENILLLTSNKSVIKANEDAILTATIPDYENAVISNRTVNFYELGDNMAKTLLGTATTDENGIATFTYTGTGAGKVDILAQVENSDYLIETFVLYDTIWYDNAVTGDTKSNEWYLSTENLSLSVESDGTGTLLSSTATSNAYSNSTSSWNKYIDASNDFCVEFDVVTKSGDFALRFMNNTSSNYRDITLTNRVSSNNHVKVEYSATNQNMTITIDGVTEANPVNSSMIYGLMVTCGFRIINTSSVKIKNFKVYSI